MMFVWNMDTGVFENSFKASMLLSFALCLTAPRLQVKGDAVLSLTLLEPHPLLGMCLVRFVLLPLHRSFG
jgi:hypothetical protein